MEYSQFQQILKEGERANVDFKIQCDAFASRRDFVPKAELAKDICAMANNGNITSYIIVGVSDDRRGFRSVSNPNLTDDNVQDFCKKAIFPPPKVKLHRASWRNALPAHAGKEFVVIQIGPQRRQVFRLAQDYIDYRVNVCFRRNEVLIRRGATSDLATPEEICRLASGQSWQEDVDEEQRRNDRESFAHLSLLEQQSAVAASSVDTLQKMGYTQLVGKHWMQVHKHLFNRNAEATSALWKRVGTTLIVFSVLRCYAGLTGQDLKWLNYSGSPDRRFVEWDLLPQPITDLTRRKIRAVRRIWLIPVTSSAPASRIARAFPSSRRSGTHLLYYRTYFEDWGYEADRPNLVPSSSELLVLDKIKSMPDFTEALTEAVSSAEREKVTILVPTSE